MQMQTARVQVSFVSPSDCPNKKWGVYCDKDCPECLNGGVCHDADGDCICPPGFMGTRCETGVFGGLPSTRLYLCTSCSFQSVTSIFEHDPSAGCGAVRRDWFHWWSAGSSRRHTEEGLNKHICKFVFLCWISACREGMFGRNCQESCSSDLNCRGLRFCQPDPYGCSCAGGWFGNRCEKGETSRRREPVTTRFRYSSTCCVFCRQPAVTTCTDRTAG